MSLDQIHIMCQGFSWPNDTEFSEVSFFSGVERTAVTPEIDLVDFLLPNGLGKLKYSFEGTDKQGNTNEMFFEVGNITLKLDSAVYINAEFPYLQDFFKIKEDTSYIKYKVRISHDAYGLIFNGTIYQDGLKEPFTNDNNSEIIDVLVTGMEKEMKQYYNSVGMIHPDNTDPYFRWSIHSYHPPTGITDILYQKFQWILNGFFSENEFLTAIEFDEDIKQWWVAKHPRFIQSSQLGGLWHNRQGYERIFQNGNSKWSWFESTCNSMGWTFFFYGDILYIRNRSSFNAPVVEYDWDLMLPGFTLGKVKPYLSYDYLMIIDGVYGNDGRTVGIDPFLNEDNLRGEMPVILSSIETFHLNTAHFSSIAGSAGAGYASVFDASYKCTKFNGETNDTFGVRNMSRSGPISFQKQIMNIDQKKILRLNYGDSGKSAWKVNYALGVDEPYDIGTPCPSNSMYFKGCFGSQLFKMDNFEHMSMSYHNGYVQSDVFRRNFAKFLDTRANIILKCDIDTLVTSPMQRPKFINSGDTFYDNAEWAIQQMEFDLVEEITHFDLFKVN